MRRRIADEDQDATIPRIPGERGVCQRQAFINQFGSIAATLGAQSPEIGSGLLDRSREVPANLLEKFAAIAISGDADPDPTRDVSHETHQVVDASLRLGDLPGHARRAVEHDRQIKRLKGERFEVITERGELLEGEQGDRAEVRRIRSRRDD